MRFLISGKIAELQVSLKKEPTLTQQKEEMIEEILSNMAYIDQEIRDKWINEDKKLEQDLIQLLKEIDKTNTMRLKKLLKLANKEWFTITEFSEFSDSNAWLIIQHAEPEVEKEFLPIIEKYALVGESNKKTGPYYMIELLCMKTGLRNMVHNFRIVKIIVVMSYILWKTGKI